MLYSNEKFLLGKSKVSAFLIKSNKIKISVFFLLDIQYFILVKSKKKKHLVALVFFSLI